jgi:hypothetical protein
MIRLSSSLTQPLMLVLKRPSYASTSLVNPADAINSNRRQQRSSFMDQLLLNEEMSSPRTVTQPFTISGGGINKAAAVELRIDSILSDQSEKLDHLERLLDQLDELHQLNPKIS